MTEFFPLLWWTLGGAAVVGAGVYLFMEYQAYLLRTSVISVPGGLRFVAQGFTVESRHGSKEIIVVARDGRYIRQPLAGGDEEIQTGSLSVTLPAVGMRIDVSRISVKGQEGEAATATGFSRITLAASDETMQKALGRSGGDRSEVRLDRVPDAIATNFQQFANGLRAWIDKIEQQIAAQVEAQRQKEAQAAVVAAGLAVEPEEDPTVPLSEEEREARAGAQLEKWRKAAGFKGSSTEMSFDARGKIVWLIDLDQTGRVILHAGDRTFHGSLLGATVVGIGSEVEVAVRDDYWTEDDTRLVAFRVLAGSTPENRRAWKERLDLLIQNLGGKSAQRST